jgi:hypothetical protein
MTLRIAFEILSAIIIVGNISGDALIRKNISARSATECGLLNVSDPERCPSRGSIQIPV